MPEEIVEFLQRNSGMSYCDRCIRELCMLENESLVSLVTKTLALSPDYRRGRVPCTGCGQRNDEATQVA